jgi:hypothetical protein
MLRPGTDRTGTHVATSVIAQQNLQRHPTCRPQRLRLQGPTGAIPKTSRLIVRSRAFAAAADGWFGDDDSASRPAEAAKANFGLPTDFARCVTQFTDGRADAN